MLKRSLLWLSLSLLIIVSLVGKWQRYGEMQPEKATAASQRGIELADFMQRAGFIAMGQQNITKEGDYQLSMFRSPTCKGVLYLMPVKTAVDSEFMLQLGRRRHKPVQFVFRGESYSHFPKWQVMFSGPIQRMRSLVGLTAKRSVYSPAIASIEMGDCKMAQHVPWNKLWFK